MGLTAFVLVGLGIYRLSRMIAVEEGPFNVFLNLRGWTAERWGLHSWLAVGIACPLCVSVWVSLAVAIFFALTLPLDVVNTVMYWGAWSAVTVILYKQERP